MSLADRLPKSFPNKVIKVRHLSGFRLAIDFKGDLHGEHDFADLMQHPGPMLDPLRDPAYIARVFIEEGALTWPNGYDMCPDALRMEMEDAGEFRVRSAAK
jgi:uncharacterized protein DUF2442